jgi:hypothetical protein
MGHGKKNANRGEAIKNNYARVEKLAEKHKELGNHLKDTKRELQDEINEILVVVDEIDEEIKKRFDDLEYRMSFHEKPVWSRWWSWLYWWWEERRGENEARAVDPPEAILTSPVKLSDQQFAELEKEFLGGTSPIENPAGLINYKKPYEKPTIKEEEMPKKGKVHRLEGHATVKADKLGPPPTPSHRQVVVDRKTPGPKKKKGEPDKTEAKSRDA